MGELSFLTIIVSLAVCSLLTYAIFQYMKVRLSILEQSHKEQALILQQYIEESSTDIHRLYQMNTMPSASRQMNHPPTGSIILEYANEREQNASAYNEPHTIHLDTAAFFQNSRGSGSKLIEISSDSEDTTDTDTGTGTSESESDTESDSESEYETGSEADLAVKNNTEVVAIETETETETNAIEVLQIDPRDITEVSTTEIKTISVDLGTMQEPEIQPKEKPSMELYKKSQETSSSVVEEPPAPAPAPAPAPESAPIPLAAMSVNDLKALLKEKCKNQPEKHAEIQRLKKAELIYAIQQLV